MKWPVFNDHEMTRDKNKHESFESSCWHAENSDANEFNKSLSQEFR